MRMAPEGWPFLAIGWGVAVLGAWATLRWGGWWWAIESVALVLAIWLLVFFRNPERMGPRGDRYVIAPADGKIVGTVETDEPAYLRTRALRISIFMSVFDVHVNRYPVSGTVAYRHYNAGQFLRVPVPNDVKYLNASGAAGTARRQVVAVENCNKCHGLLSAHGNNRNGTTQVCAVCHNPSATDQARVPAGGTVAPIDFKVLIHEVHADKIRQSDVTIYGFGGSANVFPIAFPGQVGDCNICHVNASFQLPLQPVVHDTIIPTGGTTPKTIAVCTACHDTVKFDNSASQACGTGVTGPCNHSGGTQTGDAGCAACHGAGSIADVAKVHPITAQQ